MKTTGLQGMPAHHQRTTSSSEPAAMPLLCAALGFVQVKLIARLGITRGWGLPGLLSKGPSTVLVLLKLLPIKKQS